MHSDVPNGQTLACVCERAKYLIYTVTVQTDKGLRCRVVFVCEWRVSCLTSPVKCAGWAADSGHSPAAMLQGPWRHYSTVVPKWPKHYTRCCKQQLFSNFTVPTVQSQTAINHTLSLFSSLASPASSLFTLTQHLLSLSYPCDAHSGLIQLCVQNVEVLSAVRRW